MYKFLITFCALFLFSSIAFGQDYTFSPTPSNTKKPPPKLRVPSPRPTTSPADFKKGVKTLNQKTQNELDQQAAQKFKMPQTSPTSSPTATPSTGGTKPPKVIGDPLSAQQPEQTGTDTTTPTAGRPPNLSPTDQPPPPPDFNQNTKQSDPQVYTGFPSAPQNSTQQPAQQPESNEGGWLNY